VVVDQWYSAWFYLVHPGMPGVLQNEYAFIGGPFLVEKTYNVKMQCGNSNNETEMSHTIDYQGKRIAYTRAGSGNPLVLLHGFIESKNIWKDFVHALSGEFTVFTVDLPGHGESEVIEEVHSMQLMAQVVNAVLDHEQAGPAVLVGHSMGGYVALEFARLFPHRVQGIALFHSQASPDSQEAKENRRRTINIVQQNRAGFIRQFIPDLFDQRHVEEYRSAIDELLEEAAKMSQEAIVAAIAGMRDRTGGLVYLMDTDKPVMFIIGKQDARIPYNQVLAQAVIPAHSEILLLDHVGHMGYIEAPSKTLSGVRHFALKCFSGQ